MKQKKLYLHVGIGKTGSTKIQSVLARNYSALKKCGYLFPKSPGRGHAKIAQIAWSNEDMKRRPYFRKQTEYSTPDQLRDSVVSDFREEVNASNATNVILSNETLNLLPDSNFDWLLSFFEQFFSDIKIILFIRRQDDFLVSSYKQGLIMGYKKTLEEYIDNTIQGDSSMFTAKLDFDIYLHRLSKRHPRIKLKPILYHRENLKYNDLMQLFYAACDLTFFSSEEDPTIVANKSLDAVTSEYLLQHNRNLPPNTIPSSALIEFLKKESTGPDLIIPPGLHEKILERYRDNNFRLLKDFQIENGHLLTKAVPYSGETSRSVQDLEKFKNLERRVSKWQSLFTTE